MHPYILNGRSIDGALLFHRRDLGHQLIHAPPLRPGIQQGIHSRDATHDGQHNVSMLNT
jgi:hypothetical protein